MLKCIITSLLLIIIIDWYYTNIMKQIRKQHSVDSSSSSISFSQFLNTYNKSYSIDELEVRKQIYQDNQKLIQQKYPHSRLQINQFADWKDEEYLQMLSLNTKKSRNNLNHIVRTDSMIIKVENEIFSEKIQIDWRNKSKVSPVRDMTMKLQKDDNRQKVCANAYAFVVTDLIESAFAIENGFMQNFSVQMLMDCSSDSQIMQFLNYSEVNQNCNGGSVQNALQFAWEIPLAYEWRYPYLGNKQNCELLFLQNSKYQINNFKLPRSEIKTPPGDPEAVKQLLLKGPCIAEISATSISFKFYHDSIINDHDKNPENDLFCAKGSINHAVLIVGWGVDESKNEFFIIKNNFGEQWGDQGFARISTSVSERIPFGTCNILHQIRAVELSNYFDV